MSASKAQVADKVLTDHARGYMPGMFVHDRIFPNVDVMARAGKIIVFGKEGLVKRDLKRARGASRQQLSFDYGQDSYQTQQVALDGVVPFEDLEDADAVPGVDLGKSATSMTLDNALLQTEIEAAELATKVSNFASTNKSALTGKAQWDHAESTPGKAVSTACKVIADSAGMSPNTLTVSESVHKALIYNPDVVDRIKYTSSAEAGNISHAQMAAYFDVEFYAVGKARRVTDDGSKFQEVWGNNAVLSISGLSTMRDAEAHRGRQSLGYTYRLSGYPVVGEAWQDRDRNVWRYPVTIESVCVLASAASGYLFSDVISA
ncbi:MAG: hypothetical protein F4Z71_07230 [Gammaproteobacteria bacterium]|nr:hypothetical protein [Gammaproteobacteria bacterium]MYE29244.1 hypothetical protein [Gammaproteobacteria bacterium]